MTNIPTPYRNPVYARLPRNFAVVFCAQAEANRNWQPQKLEFDHRFLAERVKARADGYTYVHNNPDIFKVLQELRPSVVITTGFNPTHLYAFLWAKARGVPHICMTDGTLASEASLSWVHRGVRRAVFAASRAFIGASNGSAALYKSYGVEPSRIFRSPLCADNDLFLARADNADRQYDVMFAGQFHERKCPDFFVDVCIALEKRRGACRALLAGDGPLRAHTLRRLEQAGIGYYYAGFLQQQELAAGYCQARILLFTTRLDPWGVVANEALASGTPVITAPAAGAAGEIVIDGVTGAVCALDVEIWASAAARLLDDRARWHECSKAGMRAVEAYTYDNAARGVVQACRYALSA